MMGDTLDSALATVRARTGDTLPPREAVACDRRSEMRLADHGDVRITWIDDNEQVHAEQARLRDSTEKGVGVYTSRPYPENQTVWLEGVSSKMRKAVVRYSRHLRPERWKTGFMFLDSERRRMTRVSADGPGMLSWGDGIRPSHAPVRVVDISELGACVEVEAHVPHDVMVKLRGEEMECMAAVRYRRPHESKLLLGLQFVCRPYDRGKARREAGFFEGEE